jgi:hypothetical protein
MTRTAPPRAAPSSVRRSAIAARSALLRSYDRVGDHLRAVVVADLVDRPVAEAGHSQAPVRAVCLGRPAIPEGSFDDTYIFRHGRRAGGGAGPGSGRSYQVLDREA